VSFEVAGLGALLLLKSVAPFLTFLRHGEDQRGIAGEFPKAVRAVLSVLSAAFRQRGAIELRLTILTPGRSSKPSTLFHGTLFIE
jgi:hypothetical protein